MPGIPRHPSHHPDARTTTTSGCARSCAPGYWALTAPTAAVEITVSIYRTLLHLG